MDAVITYVNGNDKLWLSDYNKYAKKQIEEARYRDWGTLPYLIKGIRKFMPFIDKIFLVVSGVSQVPENIDLTDVRLVYHNMIIPERYLPCFNSCTIEMFLHNISDLNEEFIYFNDDTFVLRPMKETDFFIDGKPVLNPHLVNMSIFDTFNLWQETCVNSTKLIKDKFVPKYPSNIYIKQEHIMRPMLKSTYKKVWDKCGKEILSKLTRIRHNRNYSVYIFNNYDYMTGNFVQKELNFKYIRTGDRLENIINEITNRQYDILCMNDTSAVNYNNKKCIQDALDSAIEGKEYKLNKINEKIVLKDKLYVSFTSWKKRINNCKHTVDLMSKQTLKPTKIILNLAEEEFPNKENDLPRDLINEVKKNNLFEIYWVKENTNVWKKILPTMKRFPDDLVLSIDDDIEYPDNYIEEMYKTFIDNKKLYPVVAYQNKQNNKLYHSGPFTLTNYYFYGKYLDILYNELVYPTLKEIRWPSDNVYSEALFLNHNKYILCDSIDGKQLYLSSNLNKQDAYSNYKTEEWKNTFKLTKNMLSSFVEKHFPHPNIDDKKIVVTFTTWKKRDMFVEEMLTWFQHQTIKPYKIICWIAREEYFGVVPETLQRCLDKNLLSEIRWVDKNICGHKRYEIFKDPEFEDCYIATIDDDLYYPINHLQNLLELSIKYPNCPCSYLTKTVDYCHGHREYRPFETLSMFNEVFSGLSLYPPHVFPMESFEYEDLRNKYCMLCDDSWVNAWFKIKNIPIAAFEEWHNKCLNNIDGTIEGCIWVTHNKVKLNGSVIQMYYNRMNAYKCLGFENKAKELWKDCDIDIYNTIKDIDTNHNVKVLENTKYKILVNKETGNVINTDYLKHELIKYGKNKGYVLNLDKPNTIVDKINWLKVYDVSNLKATCADKILVHKYCEEKLGKDICVPILKVYDSPNDININELPNKFVLKCNHGYAMNIICKDKNTFNLIAAKENCKKWLNDDFGLRTLQLQYSLINRKCFVEQYLENGSVGLTDYKIWCQNGVPQFVIVMNDRFNGLNQFHANVYDLNWNIFDLGWSSHKPNFNQVDSKPKSFDKMLEYAKKLSADFKFVRVDFYEVNGICYLGELTFTSDNGFFHFKKDIEQYLGNRLLLK